MAADGALGPVDTSPQTEPSSELRRRPPWDRQPSAERIGRDDYKRWAREALEMVQDVRDEIVMLLEHASMPTNFELHTFRSALRRLRDIDARLVGIADDSPPSSDPKFAGGSR